MVVYNPEESDFNDDRSSFIGMDVKYTKVVLRGFIRLKSVPTHKLPTWTSHSNAPATLHPIAIAMNTSLKSLGSITAYSSPVHKSPLSTSPTNSSFPKNSSANA